MSYTVYPQIVAGSRIIAYLEYSPSKVVNKSLLTPP